MTQSKGGRTILAQSKFREHRTTTRCFHSYLTCQDITQAAQVLKTVRETNPAFAEAEKALSTIKGKISRFASRHPLDKPIYVTDDMVLESSKTFNELSRIVLPKNLAGALTEKFIGSNQAGSLTLAGVGPLLAVTQIMNEILILGQNDQRVQR